MASKRKADDPKQDDPMDKLRQKLRRMKEARS